MTIFLETTPRRDVGTSRDRLETETSRPGPQRCLKDKCAVFILVLVKEVLVLVLVVQVLVLVLESVSLSWSLNNSLN